MRRLRYIFMSAVFSAVLFTAVSCETIADYEQDCSTKIKFEFRKHRQALQSVNGKTADVFDSAVTSVHIFVYNAETGEPVLDKFAYTQDLKTEAELKIGSGKEKCILPLDLEAGRYRMVAWCGLDENDQSNAFELSGAKSRAPYGYDECRIKLTGSQQPVNDEKYDALYHGALEVNVKSTGQTIPFALTKNTNEIAVWMQHTTATFDNGDYEVVYTDANGTMKFENNAVTDATPLEYRPHTVSMLTTSMEYNGELIEAGALVVHISTARLMAAHKKDARLEVRDREGITLFSIPFIQYLLEMQTFTTNEQYYLDCEDTYNCSFYLTGDTKRWSPSLIIINNWVKVPDQTGGIGGEND